MTKHQGSAVQEREAVAERDHSLTLPSPPPSMAYQPVPAVRVPAPPVEPVESGLHRAAQDWPDESTIPGFESGRDTVPSPPPEGIEDDEAAEATVDEERPSAEQ